jgi:two-component system torCAD operon response regulator TorR
VAVTGETIRTVLVEDDHDLRHGLSEYLRLSGIEVRDVPSGLELYKALRLEDFDVAILDVNLPDSSGFDLARELSAERGLGLILLTARTGRDDRIRGYAEGADLYLTKPIDGQELVLAVRNLARRVQDGGAGQPTAAELRGPATVAAWRLDMLRHCLVPPRSDPIQLSGREVMLLAFLAQAQGATVARATLAEHLGYAAAGGEGRGLDAVLRRLRRKVGDRGLDLPLRAIHAIGVRFAAPLLMD